MSSLKTIISIASGFVFIFAFWPYLRATIQKDATPRKATWFVWALGDIIILFGMIAKGTISGLIVGAVLGASLTFILSLKYGEKGWNTHDKVCVALALFAIGLWIYFGDSNIGIAFSLLALWIAAWPTYLSAWGNPENENKSAWVWFNISSTLAVLAIPHLTFADAAAPIMFLVIDSPMLFLVVFRKVKQKPAVNVSADM
jgi:hypothetical protein